MGALRYSHSTADCLQTPRGSVGSHLWGSSLYAHPLSVAPCALLDSAIAKRIALLHIVFAETQHAPCCSVQMPDSSLLVQEGCAERSRARFKVVPLPAIPADSLPQALPFQLPSRNPFLPGAGAAATDIDPLARRCVMQPPALLVQEPTLRLWHLQATFVPPDLHVRSA